MYMGKRLHIMHAVCKFRVTVLAFIWLSGLIVGALIAAGFSTTVSFTIRFHPSFLQILFLSLLPLWLSFLAFYGPPVFLFLIVFVKALSFGYSSVLLICFFGHIGWLIRFLMMFFGVFSVCIIWIVWLTHIADQKQRSAQGFVTATIAITFVSYLDAYVIVPIVQRLIPYL